INDKRPEDQFKPALYDRIGLAYAGMGDFRNAYLYRKLESEARQRIFSVQKQKEVDELEIRYQSEKKEKEIQQSKQEIERGHNQRNLILFIAALILTVAGFIIYLISQRRRITQQFEQEKLKMFENIVHEIRTPLALIDAPIQFMKADTEQKNKEQLLLMERNSKRLMRLVNELLDASKLGKRNFTIQYTTGDLAVFLENIIDGFAVDAISDGKTVKGTYNNIQGNYSFPSDALEKILLNLIGNALKYSPKRSTVTIASSVQGSILELTITDNGPGIPKNEQRMVFRRFFRGRYSEGTVGTGIGLSMVKELVELAGGSIALQSDTSGTTFSVKIPLKEPYAAPQAQNDAAAAAAGIPTLLLVEDDADIAAFTTTVLQDDFRIIHVSNGVEALETIQSTLPDIVLSDIMMPQKDGIQLLSDIRTNELYSHLPVVLFSARASLES
ncbi:hypothetical protein VF13_42825, partial [Nostoc linckia z16]